MILAEIQVEKISPVDIFAFRNDDFLLKFSLRESSYWYFQLFVGRTSCIDIFDHNTRAFCHLEQLIL